MEAFRIKSDSTVQKWSPVLHVSKQQHKENKLIHLVIEHLRDQNIVDRNKFSSGNYRIFLT